MEQVALSPRTTDRLQVSLLALDGRGEIAGYFIRCLKNHTVHMYCVAVSFPCGAQRLAMRFSHYLVEAVQKRGVSFITHQGHTGKRVP